METKDIMFEDQEVYTALLKEKQRQEDNIELIASENFASKAVMEAQGSIFTNKYAEGYPSKRYYGGCENVDTIENLARERLKKLFNAKFVNVQPHSGSQANMAAYRALINHGDRVLGMSLDAGGHLTHGYKLSFSGQDYLARTYGVNSEGYIDYDEVEKISEEFKPNLIIAGASAYPRFIDFKRFREIADKVGAYLMVDMAHIAGLIAAGLHQNPLPYAHIVTSTTHKTLRGPRGGIILTNDENVAKKVDKALFPGCQGGPLEHVIAAKAICFKEALDPSFKTYQEQVVKNSKAMANKLMSLGAKLITNGTDNHLMLIDVYSSYNLTGLQAQMALEEVNITTNKNSIPNDTQRPMYASGIRLGSPAMTSRGFNEEEFIKIATLIDLRLKNPSDEKIKTSILKEIKELTSKHPLNV